MLTRKHIAVAALTLLGGITAASAHTTSLGYVPGATAGTVTFWAGTYGPGHTSTVGPEGTGTLTGVLPLVYSSTQSFMGVVSSKPTGLVDGTNNFFWGSFSAGSFGATVDPLLSGGPVWWESITLTGLTAGDYDFTIANDARTTASWQNIDGLASVRLTLTGQDVSGTVPEPISLALVGLGLAGVAFTRRKQKVT